MGIQFTAFYPTQEWTLLGRIECYDLTNLGTMGSVSPQSRVVELLRPVGGGDDDEAVVVGRRQSVEAGEELGLESTRGLVVALPPRAQDRVDLV